MGKISVLNKRGDLSLTWDAANPRQVARGKRFFDKLFGLNYIAFVPAAGSESGAMTREFDPNANSIVMTRPIVGG